MRKCVTGFALSLATLGATLAHLQATPAQAQEITGVLTISGGGQTTTADFGGPDVSITLTKGVNPMISWSVQNAASCVLWGGRAPWNNNPALPSGSQADTNPKKGGPYQLKCKDHSGKAIDSPIAILHVQ